MVTGPFCLTNETGRCSARKTAEFCSAAVDAAVQMKWTATHPGVDFPTEMPTGGFRALIGFDFSPAVFDTFGGGCSEDTAALFMSYATRVASRQRTNAKRVYNRVRVYKKKKISYCIWSASAQAVILRRPKSIWDIH